MKHYFRGGLAGLFLAMAIWSCMDNPYDPKNIPDTLNIKYSSTRLNDSLSAYCFYPIDLEIKVPRNEQIYIDSIFFRMSDASSFEKVNNYKVSFSYSTVGAHSATVRYYFLKDMGKFKDTTLIFTTGINYAGKPVDQTLDIGGSSVDLEATGYKADSSILWHWDLSRIGRDTATSESGALPVFIDGEYDDTVFLSQVNAAGQYSPRVAVPFMASFYRAGIIPFTVSRINSNYNNYCFFPITFTANPRQANRAVIDSITLRISEGINEYTHRLTPANNYTAIFNYADTGVHLGRMRVFYNSGVRAEMPSYDTAFIVRVGADFRVVSDLYMVSDTGGVITLKAGGNKANGVYWEWDMAGIRNGTVRILADTVTATISRQDVNRQNTVFLRQIMVDGTHIRGTHVVSHLFTPVAR